MHRPALRRPHCPFRPSFHLSPMTRALAAAGLLAMPLWLQAQVLPQGLNVVQGQASVATQGALMTVKNSPGAILNWNSFNIGAGAGVRFDQASAASKVLNRVVGNEPSAIFGSLSSNGHVWLLNPNGVLFGAGARVDVAGLVASTLRLNDNDFISGRYRFNAAEGDAGTLRNEGSLRSSFGGQIVMLGSSITNTGSVEAPGGSVALAAARSVELVDTGLPNLAVRVDVPAGEVLNLGRLAAAGGTVDVWGGIVNQSGLVAADTLGVDAQGRVTMRAADTLVLGEASRTTATGASDGSASARGGQIDLLAPQVGAVGQAIVDASGGAGGGRIRFGGGFQGQDADVPNARAAFVGGDVALRADATVQGHGGRVVVWADEVTRFAGQISARGGPLGGDGGQAEASGKHSLVFRGVADLRAPLGHTGSLLLDPDNITIQTGGTAISGNISFSDFGTSSITVDAGSLGSLLQGASVSLQANNAITVASAVNGGAAGSGALTLLAGGDITVNAALTANGITLSANNSGSNLAASAGKVVVNAAIDARSGDLVIANTTRTGGGTHLLGAALSGQNITITGTSTLTADAVWTTQGSTARAFGPIGGTFSLTKAGSGTLTLSGNNSYTGGTTLGGGTLALGSTDAIGSSGTVSFNGGALQFSADNTTDYSARFSTASGQLYQLDTNGQAVTLATALTSAGGTLTKLGAGTLTLVADNAYSGTTTVNAGTLQIGDLSALGNFGSSGTLGSGAVINNGALVFIRNTPLAVPNDISGTGSLTYDGSFAGQQGPPSFNTLTLTGNNTYTGVTTVSAGTLQIGAGGVTGTLGSGAVTNNTSLVFNRSDAVTVASTIGGLGSLQQAGTGTLTLSGNNSYSGGTTVSAGTLTLGADDALPGVSSVVVNGGTLDIGTRSTAVTSLSLQSGAVTGTTGVLTSTVDVAASSGSIGANLGGSAGLTKTTSGTVTLSGANTFTGATTVTGGTLSVSGVLASDTVNLSGGNLTTSATNLLANTATVNLNSGTLTLGGTDAVQTLTLAGGSLAGSPLSVNRVVVNTSTTFPSNIVSANVLDVTAGTLTVASPLPMTRIVLDGGNLTTVGPDLLVDTARVGVRTGSMLTLGGNDTIDTLDLSGSLNGIGSLNTRNAALSEGAAINAVLGTLDLGAFGSSDINSPVFVTRETRVSGGTLTIGAPLRSRSVILDGGNLTTVAPNVLVDIADFTVNRGSTLTLGGPGSIDYLTLQGGTLGAGSLLTSLEVTLRDGATVNGSLNTQLLYSLENTSVNGTVTAAVGTGVINGTMTLRAALAGVIVVGIDTNLPNTANLTTTAANLLSNSASVRVLNGGTLTLGGTNTVGTLGLFGGSLAGSALTVTGAITATASGTLPTTIASAGSLVVDGGTLTVTGPVPTNTITVNGGTLSASAGNLLANTANVTVNTGGTLTLNGNYTVSSLALGGTLAGSGRLTAATYSLANGAAVRADLGAGELTSTGSTSISGTVAAETVNVNSGILSLQAGNRLTASPAVTVAGVATLALAGDETFGLLAGAGTLAMGGGTLTTGSLGDSSYSGRIAGSGGLSKAGIGTFTLNGDHSYTGATTVNSGALALQGASISGPGLVTVASGASLALSAGASIGAPVQMTGATLSGSSGSGVITGALDLTDTTVDIGTGATLTAGGAVVANGTLTKTGAGTFSLLSGADAAGTVTLDAGTLAVNGTTRLNNLQLRGGTLAGSGAVTVTGNLDASTAPVELAGSGTLTTQGASLVQLPGAGGSVDVNKPWVNAGTLSLAGNSSLRMNTAGQTTGSLSNAAGGVLNVGSTLATGISGNAPFVNAGALNFNAPASSIEVASIVNSGTLDVLGGTLSLVTPSLQNPGILRVASGGTLSTSTGFTNESTGVVGGNGTLVVAGGSGTFTNRGSLVAGGNFNGGTFTVNGNVDLADGTLLVALGGPAAGQSGQLAVGGNLNLGGQLNATLRAGYTPAQADAIPLITYGGVSSGTAPRLTLPAGFTGGFNLAAGEALRAIFNNLGGTLVFSNAAGDLNWATPANWGGSLPGALDGALISSGFAVAHDMGDDTIATLSVNSSNALTVSGGSLTVTGATNLGGSLAVAPGGVLALQGAVTGGGAAAVSGGTLTLNGATALSSLSLTGGQIGGTGSLTVNGSFSRSGGTVANGFSAVDITQASGDLRPGALAAGTVRLSTRDAASRLIVDDIVSAAGAMDITAAGSLEVLAAGSAAALTAGGDQTVTAASVLLQGAGTGSGHGARIDATGNQSITVTDSGSFSVLGGSGTSNVAQITAQGLAQTIVGTGGALVVTGGASGTGNAAGISAANASASTVQSVSGFSSVQITGGTAGTNNLALLGSTAGAQNISAAALVLQGGADGSNNAAVAQAPAGSQTVNISGNASLTAGAAGMANPAVLTAPTQTITVGGNLTLQGGASSASGGLFSDARIGGPDNGVGPGNLVLNVGGSLTMSGGSNGSGAVIGYAAAVTQDTTIAITAGGDIRLNPGTQAGSGARIGSVVGGTLAGGDISLAAPNGTVRLNGSFNGGAAAEVHLLTAGHITLDALNLDLGSAISGQTVRVRAGNLLQLRDAALLTATATSGDSIVLRTGAGGLDNSAGASVLSVAGSARWLGYAPDPSLVNAGGLLADFKQYAAPFGTTPAASGNGLLLALAPTLTATLQGSVNKVYDATAAATVAPANFALSGAHSSDSVAITSLAGGTYESKNVGSGLTVSATGLTAAITDGATGAPVYGYAFNGTASGAVGTITPAALSLAGLAALDKTYDGNTSASVTGGLAGVRPGDAVTVSIGGSFADAGAGTGKPVAYSASTSGADAGNYTLAGASGDLTASIRPATLSYRADPLSQNVGLPIPLLTGTVTGFIGAETVASATTGSLVFTTSATTTTAAGSHAITGGGLLATNYLFVQEPGNAQALTLSGLFAANPSPVTVNAGTVLAQTLQTLQAPAVMSAPSTGRVLDVTPTMSQAADVTAASAPAGAPGAGFQAVNFSMMARADVQSLMAARDQYKKQTFATGLAKLEQDPQLADIRPCVDEADAAAGRCLMTPQLRQEIQERLARASAHQQGPDRRRIKHAAVPSIARKLAVLIGINHYSDKRVPTLSGSIPDVRAIRDLLEGRLGYETVLVEDGSREAIVRALNQVALQAGGNDSVIVYYAGHGVVVPVGGVDTGFWLPADGNAEDPGTWLSNADIGRLVSAIGSKQVMLVSDSCYSGSLVGNERVQVDRSAAATDLLSRRAMVVLSSGGNEPVADEGRDGHSVFAWHFMQALENLNDWQVGSTLFERVRAAVVKDFPQTPQYGASRAAGYQGNTDYLFERREFEAAPR
jgi:fibronectin-binding autotransporter adhesin